MLDELKLLARRYADLQREAALTAGDAALRRHISDTLMRCLPSSCITAGIVSECFHAVQSLPRDDDPMHTGAIHAYAGEYLLNAADANDPLLARLHHAALRLLNIGVRATRDDLRLVSLDALYEPGLLRQGTHIAYLHYRLGRGCTRLSNEEIALRMHKPLVYIHELEAAILSILSSQYSGGCHA